MGNSFIEYRGHGFWSADRFIEQFVGETAQAIEKIKKGGWITDLAAHWRLQASGEFGGWVHLKLDEFLTDDERREQVRKVVETITLSHADDDPIRQTGVLFLRLLDGNLNTDAASPLDYMIGGAGAGMDQRRR